MISNEKIAFFDSGVGGLTVLDKFKKLLPHEDCVYFGDLKNSPYGEKSKNELLEIANSVFKFLETKNVKAVIMACNTTSANTYEELKDKYNFKIYPIIQSCAKVIATTDLKSLGVFATEATIKSGVYSKELKKYNSDLKVFEMSCPEWVKIVENNTQNLPENIEVVKGYVTKMLKNFPDKIILGCTHYPYLMNIFSKFADVDLFIDPAIYFAEYVKSDLEKLGLLNDKQTEGKDEFYVTANPEKFMLAAKMFYELDELPTLVSI